jgi:hypothetical protein
LAPFVCEDLLITCDFGHENFLSGRKVSKSLTWN